MSWIRHAAIRHRVDLGGEFGRTAPRIHHQKNDEYHAEQDPAGNSTDEQHAVALRLCGTPQPSRRIRARRSNRSVRGRRRRDGHGLGRTTGSCGAGRTGAPAAEAGEAAGRTAAAFTERTVAAGDAVTEAGGRGDAAGVGGGRSPELAKAVTEASTGGMAMPPCSRPARSGRVAGAGSS